MKATPLAQYLEQKSRGSGYDWPSARRESVTPVAAGPAVVSYEQRAQAASVFRRSNLASASPPSPTPSEAEPASAYDSYVQARGMSAVFGRNRPPPQPEPDIESRLNEAYHRGVQEGLDAARAEAATARALERAELQKRAVVERLDFQMNEYSKLAEVIAAGLAELERRIAETVAQILQPVLMQAVSKQVITELAENIGRIVSAGRPGVMRVRGPERLLAALRARLSGFAVEVEYVEDATAVEVVVEAQHTTIRTELAPWAQLIASQAGP